MPWLMRFLAHPCLRVEIERLIGLGAKLMEGPVDVPGGPIIAFFKLPGDVRVELLQLTR